MPRLEIISRRGLLYLPEAREPTVDNDVVSLRYDVLVFVVQIVG
jgi:hypothetical protein